MKLGRRYMAGVLELDPFAEIAPYLGPVLIVHGTKDDTVHPDYARRAYENYRGRPGANAPVYLERIEGGGHGFSRKHDKAAIGQMIRFITGSKN